MVVAAMAVGWILASALRTSPNTASRLVPLSIGLKRSIPSEAPAIQPVDTQRAVSALPPWWEHSTEGQDIVPSPRDMRGSAIPSDREYTPVNQEQIHDAIGTILRVLQTAESSGRLTQMDKDVSTLLREWFRGESGISILIVPIVGASAFYECTETTFKVAKGQQLPRELLALELYGEAVRAARCARRQTQVSVGEMKQLEAVERLLTEKHPDVRCSSEWPIWAGRVRFLSLLSDAHLLPVEVMKEKSYQENGMLVLKMTMTAWNALIDGTFCSSWLPGYEASGSQQ